MFLGLTSLEPRQQEGPVLSMSVSVISRAGAGLCPSKPLQRGTAQERAGIEERKKIASGNATLSDVAVHVLK